MSGEADSDARVALSALLVTPKKPAPGAADDAFDYYPMEAFGKGGAEVVLRAALPVRAQAVEPGDVLLSRLVDAPRRAWVVGECRGRPLAASADWLAVRAREFDPIFLRHLLVSNHFHLRFSQAIAGGKRARLARSEELGAIDVAMPALSEQRRMGRALACADELRTKRSAVAALAGALPRALFEELFRGSRDAAWPSARVGELTSEGPVPGDVTEVSDRGECLVLRACNVADGRLDLSQCAYAGAAPEGGSLLADGDLLIARASDDPAGLRATVVCPGPSKWRAHAQLLRLRFHPERACAEYVRAFLASDAGRLLIAPVLAPSRRRAALEPNDFSNLAIPLPPLETQRRFAASIGSVRALEYKLAISANRLDALLSVLRDAAFRGELRLA